MSHWPGTQGGKAPRPQEFVFKGSACLVHIGYVNIRRGGKVGQVISPGEKAKDKRKFVQLTMK